MVQLTQWADIGTRWAAPPFSSPSVLDDSIHFISSEPFFSLTIFFITRCDPDLNYSVHSFRLECSDDGGLLPDTSRISILDRPHEKSATPVGFVRPLQQLDFIWPTKQSISQIQSMYDSEASALNLNMDDANGIYFYSENIFWVPPDPKQLQLRLLVIAYCGSSGHRRIAKTLSELRLRF